MKILKDIPITYKGELHKVKLINFSVDIEEVQENVPEGIEVRKFENGKRALISMVNVRLKNMRPNFLPEFCSFEYQHIAFRLLVNDAHFNEGNSKGLFFYQSFTRKKHIAWGGSLFTDYQLQSAKISDTNGQFELKQANHFVRYTLDSQTSSNEKSATELQSIVGALDRAYSMRGKELKKVQIQREKWPLQSVNCTHFETNFFESAKLEGVFIVPETIYYTWLPAKTMAKL